MLWIPITIGAAGLQVARNAAQRGMLAGAGPWGATLSRFLFGLPFALVFAAVALALTPHRALAFGGRFWIACAIGGGAQIVAIITRHSLEDLGLAPGREAIALIKSSFVILAKGDETLRTSARNHLAGTVVGVERGAVNDEVTLDIGGGKILTATVTHESAEALAIAPGERLLALIKASHVILAVE